MEFETDHFNCPSNFPPTPTINNQKEEDSPYDLNFPGPKDRLFNKKTGQTKLNTNFSPNQTNNKNKQDLKGTKTNLNPPPFKQKLKNPPCKEGPKGAGAKYQGEEGEIYQDIY